MKMHLRLAERQGLLQGRHISPVQVMGLMILNHLDLIEKEENDVTALKLSLVNHQDFDYKQLFPTHFGKTEDVEIIEVSGEDEIPDGAAVDYSHVEWKSPSDDMDEYYRIMDALQSSSSGIFSGSDLAAEPTWTEWQ